VAPDISLREMLSNCSRLIVSYFRSPNLFTDGGIVAHRAVRIREFGPWIYARIFVVNAEMASAC